MPIFFVEKDILNQCHDCVVCPTKSSKVFEFDGIDNMIYEKAGKEELWKAYDKVNPYEVTVPVITSGFNLCKNIIHIIGPDFIYCNDFKKDIYNSYHLLIKVIIEKRYKDIVFPPIPYSHKRLGNMNSYRTGITLIKYFYDLYAMDCNIYILVDKQTIYDHVYNYKSAYISTSFPLSKRHKPTIYPLTNYNELREYIINNSLIPFTDLLKKRKIDYKTNDIKQIILYKLIKKKYGKNEAKFFINSNLSFDKYQNILLNEKNIFKEELLAIALSLNFSLIETNKLLAYYNIDSLNINDKFEKIIVESLNKKIYDVIRINEILFLNNCKQIGNID